MSTPGACADRSRIAHGVRIVRAYREQILITPGFVGDRPYEAYSAATAQKSSQINMIPPSPSTAPKRVSSPRNHYPTLLIQVSRYHHNWSVTQQVIAGKYYVVNGLQLFYHFEQ